MRAFAYFLTACAIGLGGFGMYQHIFALSGIEKTEAETVGITGTRLAEVRLRLTRYYQQLEDREASLRNAQQAVQAAPNLYEAHATLAVELVHHAEFDKALRELSWCARRRPHDPQIKAMHASIQRARNATSSFSQSRTGSTR